MTDNIYDVDNMSDEEAAEKARALGWHDKDEYNGNPENFTDAKTFLARSNENIPMLRENYRKMESFNQKILGELETLKKQNDGFMKRLEDAERKGYEKAVKDIEEQQRRAAVSGDLETYDRLAEQKKALANSGAEPQTQTYSAGSGDLPIADQIALEVFNTANPWFRNDRDLNEDMSAYVIGIKSRNPNMPMSEVLEKAKAKVVKANPDKFSGDKKSNEVLSGNGAVKSSYGELQDRAAYDVVWAKMERSMQIKGWAQADIDKAKKQYQANCLNNK